MKTSLATLWLLACALAVSSGAAPLAPAAAPSTNKLVIVSDIRSVLTATNAYWLGRVRAGDGEIYLECELLTAYFNTNSVRTNAIGTNTAAKPAAPRRAGEKEPNTKFELLVAETNVMIISGGRQIVGDHAEYFATNDFLFVTGKEHLRVLHGEARMSKAEVQAALYRRLTEPHAEFPAAYVASPDNVMIAVVRGTAMYHTWYFCPFHSSNPVTRAI